MIGFGLLTFGAGIAVGVISYEAIDWDADDFGDGDGKVCINNYKEHKQFLFFNFHLQTFNISSAWWPI